MRTGADIRLLMLPSVSLDTALKHSPLADAQIGESTLLIGDAGMGPTQPRADVTPAT